MHGAPQRRQQDRRPQTDPPGDGRGVREQRHRLEAGDPPENLLDDPRAREAQRLDARQERANLRGIDRATEKRLRDRDPELEWAIHAAHPITPFRGDIVDTAERPAESIPTPGVS